MSGNEATEDNGGGLRRRLRLDLFTPHSHNSDRQMALRWIYHFNCHTTPVRLKLYTGPPKKEVMNFLVSSGNYEWKL